MTNKEIITTAVNAFTEKVADGTVVKYAVKSEVDYEEIITHYAAIYHKEANLWRVTASYDCGLSTIYNYGEFMEFLASDDVAYIGVLN